MKRKSTRIPRWGQWAAGIALMLVALVAGGLSGAMNIAYGLKAGPAVAVAYGLSDAGKLLLPIVAAAIGWRLHMRLAAILTAVVSVWCAVNYLADQHGAQLLRAEHSQAVYADTAQRIAELEKQLAAANDGIAYEIANGGCGPNCRAHQDRAEAISAKLAAARKQRAEMAPVEMSGLAGWLALAGVAAKATAAQVLAAVKTIAALAVIEVLAHMAGIAAGLIGTAYRRSRNARRKAPDRGPGQAADRGARTSPPPHAAVEHIGGNVVPLPAPEDRAARGLKSLAGV